MRALAFLSLLVAGAFMTGCAGVTQTKAEVKNTYKEVADMDARQLSDDWNMLWLADREYRLTRWNLR